MWFSIAMSVYQRVDLPTDYWTPFIVYCRSQALHCKPNKGYFSSYRTKFPYKYLGTLITWLVVWNIFYCSIYWECHHPNWLSYFSDGLKPPTRPCWLVMKWGLCYSLLSRMCIQVGIPMINQYFMGWNRSVFKAHVDRIKICLHQ